MMKSSHLAFVSALLCTGLIASCSSGTDRNESVSEIATAAASGFANTRPDGTLAKAPRFSLLREAIAGFPCPVPATGSLNNNCSVDGTGKVMTLTYNSCNFGNNSAVWKGSLVLTSSSPVSCGSFPSEADGETLTRTFGEGTTRTIGNSVHVTRIDTATPSGYSTPVSGGTRITFQSSTDRKIEVLGVHVTATKQFRGNGNDGRVETVWDHTVSTAEERPLQAQLVSGGVVLNGTLVTQNNLDQSTGTSVFENVVYAPGCCHPIAGSVTTTLSGSQSGTETLSFSSDSCGSAEFKNLSGKTSTLSLVHCL